LHEALPGDVNKRKPNHYIRDIKKYINANDVNSLYLFKTDLKNFYGTIDHKSLYKLLEKKKLDSLALELIKKAVENPTVPITYRKKDKDKYVAKSGVPQGLAISNVLAQIYIHEFDILIQKKGMLYLRYVDDIIVLGKRKLLKGIQKEIKSCLPKGTKMNRDKTLGPERFVGTNYLGYKIGPSKISILESNVQKFIYGIAAEFTKLRKIEGDALIRPGWLANDDRLREIFLEELNEKITGAKSLKRNYGWVFYFIEMDDVKILFRIDKIITNFFKTSKLFNNNPPHSLKRLVRAYFEIKHNNGGNYVHDYDTITTFRQKRNYLINRGKIDPKQEYSKERVEELYKHFKDKALRKLENDIGYNSY
jgi:hypothetical protein